MKLTSALLVVLASCALPACSGATEEGADPQASALERSESTTGAYRMAGGEGNFIIRLTRAGDDVEGRALIETGNEGPGGPLMPVKGTVASDGTHQLSLTFKLKGESVVPLVLKAAGADLVGTIGEADDREPARLVRIKSDLDVPVVARFRDETTIGQACQFQVAGVELFGMRNRTLETKLNAAFHASFDEARAACREEGVSGSVFLGALTKDVIAYSSGFTVFRANDGVDLIDGKRVNLSMTDGSPVGLWGDVLAPGKQRELGDLIAARIEETPDNFMPADKKPVMKALMARRLAAGELEGDFLLVANGVSFGAKGSPMEKVRSIMVPYEKLRPILSSNGKARSAWATVSP